MHARLPLGKINNIYRIVYFSGKISSNIKNLFGKRITFAEEEKFSHILSKI